MTHTCSRKCLSRALRRAVEATPDKAFRREATEEDTIQANMFDRFYSDNRKILDREVNANAFR